LGYCRGSLPVTERVVEEILSLPMYAELNSEQIDAITGAVSRYDI